MFQQSKILIIIIIIIKTYVPLIPPLSIINWLLNVHGLVLWLVIRWIKMTGQLSLDVDWLYVSFPFPVSEGK